MPRTGGRGTAMHREEGSFDLRVVHPHLIVVRDRRGVPAPPGQDSSDGRGAVRAAIFAVAVVLLVGGCSDDKPAAASATISPEVLKKNCADPKWKEDNLGL